MTQTKEDTGVYHLTVGTEVSAKYRGAFCEAQIKLVKKNVIFKILNKKNNKCYNLAEESLRGILKISSVVEAQFLEQAGWQEGVIQAAKDRSSYTVVFDDGDERTLTRGSLCLKGDRHYAKSETLDNLPLTDPENFGTPVLANKKNRSRRRPQQEEDDDSEDQKTPDRTRSLKTKEKVHEDDEEATSEDDAENEDERRERWLADPFMGKVVIVEPTDKRKHWFPGLIVNPLCCDSRRSTRDSQYYVVRSFKNGRFLRFNRSCVKELSTSSIPSKIDASWKEVVQSAFDWKDKGVVPDEWRIDIKDILDDSDEEEDEENVGEGKDEKTKKEKANNSADVKEQNEEEKMKNYDFLETLYKFMEDRGSGINKNPVLGYKDLDLYLLYRLVQEKKGYSAITSVKEWKEIYSNLGIPKQNQAAGYNVKTAYAKYLGPYEEYCLSWKRIEAPRKSRRSRSPAQAPVPEEKKKSVSKRKDEGHISKILKKEENKETEPKKKQQKEKKESPRGKNSESNGESKTKGRMSPIDAILDDLPTLPRRTTHRRRVSESSSTSDVQTTNKKDIESKQNRTGIKVPRAKTEDKVADKFIFPGAADSEPDDSQSAAKITEKKANFNKQNCDQASVARRKRRNSTSNLSMQYLQGDKLKVKYGQGKTYKLYDAKVLQVKPPDNPAEPTEYLVHYAGWNSRHDEWIKPGRIIALLEERSPVPGSANSIKSLPKRPKTPNSTNGSKTPLMTKINPFESSFQDVTTPELEPYVLLAGKLSYSCEPERKIKPTTPIVVIPKKNLTADFAKTALSPTDQESISIIRPVSPVLRSSKKSKSSVGSAPLPPVPTVTSLSVLSSSTQQLDDRTVEMEEQTRPTTPISIVKKETTNKQISSESDNSVPVKENDEPEVLLDPVKKENEDTTIVEDAVQAKPGCDEPILKPLPDSTVSEGQCNQEECSEKDKSDLCVSAEDPNQSQSSSYLQQTRRMSNRRSKSPAYLSDSPLCSLAKRRKSSISTDSTPTLSPAGAATEEKSLETFEEAENRSASPTFSTSSTNSSLSLETLIEKEKKLSDHTGITTSNSTVPEENCKVVIPKRRVGRPSNASKIAEQKEKEADPEPEPNVCKVQDNELTSQYDNFDEEVPCIALEKPNKSRVATKKSESIKLENSPSIISTTQVPIKLFKQDETAATTTPSEAGMSSSSSKEHDTAAETKKDEEDTSKMTKRKIRKKKSISELVIPSRPIPLEEDRSAGLVSACESTSSFGQPLDVDNVDTFKSSLQNDSASMLSEDSQESTRPTSNEEDYSQPSVHNVLTLPRDAPSSSKVLLENTPPTTPERSPPYASEDQETDHSKEPPLDMMDITEEHKDSSTGSTCSSSSGCDNQTSSSQEYEKIDENTQLRDDKASPEDERLEDETVDVDNQVQSPAPKKKQGRRRKRRRTSSKSQGRRHGSYGAEPDTESEEDDAEDDDTRSSRKRHESGSRCKPRKKRAKYRPEPPSAPPPVQCEELASMSQEERITLLQARMAEMRKVYHQLKQEVANIDRKRKRAKRREKEAAEAAALLSGKRGNSPFLTPTKTNPNGGSSPCMRKTEVVAHVSSSDTQEKDLVPDGNNNDTQSATLNVDGKTMVDSR